MDIEREKVEDLLRLSLVKPMSEYVKNGTMVRLLVLYEDGDLNAHPLYDSNLAWTIGFNNFDDSEIDKWYLAGWNWSQDFFTESSGEPLAWLPFEPIFPEIQHH